MDGKIYSEVVATLDMNIYTYTYVVEGGASCSKNVDLRSS